MQNSSCTSSRCAKCTKQQPSLWVLPRKQLEDGSSWASVPEASSMLEDKAAASFSEKPCAAVQEAACEVCATAGWPAVEELLPHAAQHCWQQCQGSFMTATWSLLPSLGR